MKDLILEYNKKKDRIKERLKEFKELHKAKDEDIFQELCFCLLTPQSRAVRCDRAIKELKRSGLLFKGGRGAIKSKLKGVRFPNNKAVYLLVARKTFKAGSSLDVKGKLDVNDPLKTREWLVRNIKGLGYKEASHFLRNIGLGEDLAILDVHILRNLKKYEIIKKIPSSISRKKYIDVENKMKKFSQRIKIPLEELDLLFWSLETNFIFK